MSLLEMKNATVSYDGYCVLKDASLKLESGDWLMVVGPNGAGKSTLISAAGGNAPYT